MKLDNTNKLSLAALGLYNYILEFDIRNGFTVNTIKNITGCDEFEINLTLDELVTKGYVDCFNNIFSLNVERFVEISCGPCDDETDDDYLWEDDLDD